MDNPVRAFDARVNPGDDGTILLVRGNDVYELDEVGSFIWRHCDGDTSLAQIAAALVAEFDVADATAREDVVAFVSDLREAHLIEP